MQPQHCAYQSGFGWHHNLRDMGPYVKDGMSSFIINFLGDLFVGSAFPVLYRTSTVPDLLSF